MLVFRSLAVIPSALLILPLGNPAAATAQEPRAAGQRIGVILAESGDASFLGQAQRRLLEEMFRAHEFPEIREADLELRFVDSAGDPGRALRAYHELASDPSVIAVIGPSTSAEALSLAETSRELRVPVLSLAASQSTVIEEFPDGSFRPRPWIFKFAPGNELAAERLSDDIIWEGRRRRIFLLNAGDAFGRNGAEVLKARLQEADQEVINLEFPTGDFDAYRYALKIPRDMDAIVIWGTSPGPAMLVRALRTYENNTQIYLSHANASQSFIESSEGAADGALVVGPKVLVEPSLLRPGDPQERVIMRYRELWGSRFPGEPSPFAGHAHDALLALTRVVLSSSDRASRDSVRQGLEQLGEFPGVTGIFGFTATDHAGLPGNALALFRISRGRLESRHDRQDQEAGISLDERSKTDWVRSTVAFEGGNADSNIVSLYRFLFDHDALPLRWSTLDEGGSIESSLLKNNTLFRYSPPLLSELLRELNPDNANPDNANLVIRPGRPIVVPDMHFEVHQYLVALYPKGETLEVVATESNLYRDRDGQRSRRRLAEDEERLALLQRLNPRLERVGPDSRSHGRIMFLADGFRLEMMLPSPLSDEYRGLLEVLDASGGHMTVEQAGFEKAQSTPQPGDDQKPEEVLPAAVPWECSDPLNELIRDQLAAIRYRLPGTYFSASMPDARVFILDRFPRSSERQNVYRAYQLEITRLMRDGGLDEHEHGRLEKLKTDYHIDEATAKVLEEELETRELLEVYHLYEHREFREQIAAEDLDEEIVDREDGPLEEHGLHVAGIIGARCNRFGISGIHPSVRLEAFDVDETLSKWLGPAMLAHNCFAKPCILNASFVGPVQSGREALARKIKDFTEGLLVIAAAGNGHDSEDASSFGGAIDEGGACPVVPACLGDSPNVITVTAFSDDSTNLLPKANYSTPGKRTVSLAAPGTAVLSSIQGDKFGRKSGTSQATAFVTGAAVLLQAVNDRLRAYQLRQRLLYTADLHVNYQQKVYFGRLNVNRAIDHHNEDIVYVGKDVSPLRGMLKRRNSQLLLYENGSSGNMVPMVRANRVRRIFKQRGMPKRWTVVYQDQERPETLHVARNVTFYPHNDEKWIGDRLTETFQLRMCLDQETMDQHDLPIRTRIKRCPEDPRDPLPIRLDQIHDLIVSADAD